MPKRPERTNPPNQQRPEVALSNEKTTNETESFRSNHLVTNEEPTSPPPYSIENGIDNPVYKPEGNIVKENM
jgi:hypothetical protein